MEDKDKRKLEELTMRCRTIYRDSLKLAADYTKGNFLGHYRAMEHITSAAGQMGKALDKLNIQLAENGIFTGDAK